MNIKSEELFRLLTNRCLKKINDNAYKGSPMECEFDYLEKRLAEEQWERVCAFKKYQETQASGDLENLLDEFADEVNFIAFQFAKILGFDILER